MIQDEEREIFIKKLETYYAEKIDEVGVLKNEKTEIEKIQRDHSKHNLPQSRSHINGAQEALIESTRNKIIIRIDIAIELFKKHATEDKDYEWLCDRLCEWAENQYKRAVKTIDHYVKSRGIKVTISDSFIETPLFESKSKIKRKTEIARDSWKDWKKKDEVAFYKGVQKLHDRNYQLRLNRSPLGGTGVSPSNVKTKVNEQPFFTQALMDKASDEKISKLMEELNICYKNDCFIASGLLARSILERVLDVKTKGEIFGKKDSKLKRKIDKCLEKNVFNGKAKEALNNLKSAKFLGDLAAHYNYIVIRGEVDAHRGPLHIIIEDISDIK